MSFKAEFPQHLLQSDMQAIPSHDADDGDLPETSYEHRNHQVNLIKRKPVGSNSRVQVGCVPSDIWSEKRSLTTTAWRTKWNRVGPLLGLAGLIFTILSILIAFGILRASDSDYVSSWRYSPNVYLAIMTSITGKATSLAALQGAMIAWWLRAMHGTTLEQLHFDWSMGQNIWDALIAGRRINMIAIACICGTIAAIDAPLLQRASSVVSRSPNTEVMLDVNLVPQIPGYYSGQTSYDDTGSGPESQGTDPNPDFYPVMMSWINNETIPAIVSGCPDTCAITLRAPMIATWNCTETSRYVNYTETLPGNYSWDEITNNPALKNRTAFYTDFRLLYDSTVREFLPYWIGMSDQDATDTCAGHYIRKNCLAASAIGEYDLLVRDNETFFAQGVAKPRFIAWSNNTAMNNQTAAKYSLSVLPGLQYQANYNSTFSGIAFALIARYATIVQFIPIAWPYHPNIYGVTGLTPWMFSHIRDYIAFNRGNACIPAWIDPSDDLLAGMNELAFRIGVHTSRPAFRENLLSQQYNPLDPGVEISYRAPGTFVSKVNVFEVDYLFFFGAATVELICVLVILYTYNGWWRLGRAVTFSPLEMANAFEAPLLMHVNSNSNADDIAKALGSYKVKYGAVGSFVEEADGSEAEKLALTDRVDVQEPRKGMTFRW